MLEPAPANLADLRSRIAAAAKLDAQFMAEHTLTVWDLDFGDWLPPSEDGPLPPFPLKLRLEPPTGWPLNIDATAAALSNFAESRSPSSRGGGGGGVAGVDRFSIKPYSADQSRATSRTPSESSPHPRRKSMSTDSRRTTTPRTLS